MSLDVKNNKIVLKAIRQIEDLTLGINENKNINLIQIQNGYGNYHITLIESNFYINTLQTNNISMDINILEMIVKLIEIGGF